MTRKQEQCLIRDLTEERDILRTELIFENGIQHRVEEEIKRVEEYYASVLTGSLSTVAVNAPRALMQLEAETKLKTLHWVIGKKYVSKLKGVNL